MRVSVSEHERVRKLGSLSRRVLLSSMCESATTAPVRHMQECDSGRKTHKCTVCVISSTVRIREIATVWGEKYVSFYVCFAHRRQTRPIRFQILALKRLLEFPALGCADFG